MTLRPVPTAELDEWLPQIDLTPFTVDGAQTVDDLIADLRAKRRQLWTIPGQVVVLTEVMQDRLNTVFLTHCAGVDYKSWLHLFGVIEAWARDLGAKRIGAYCRPGWERVLTDMKKTHVILEKRLD
ncbi:MAG: hypothetical protein ACRCSU_07895 [Paracoccaceae bacterium]